MPVVRLAELGRRVGRRFAELLLFRERAGKRETKANSMMLLVQSTLWKVRVCPPAPKTARGRALLARAASVGP
jgi:hypothetical protein